MKQCILFAGAGAVLYLLRDPLAFLPGSGMLTLLWLLAVAVFAYLLLLRLPLWLGRILSKGVLQKVLMLFISLWMMLFMLQIVLTVFDRYAAKTTAGKSVIPPEWDKIPLPRPPGCREAYKWHGHDHYFFAEGFRRTVPLEPKPEGALRVVFFGDSLTYAQGIAAENSYVSLLAQSLSEQAREHGRSLDVVNLGVCGANSPDVLEFAYRYISLLQPDLLVYGICMNDVHPSGRYHEYVYRWKLPLPESFKLWMWERTRVWRWLATKYNDLLMRIGLRDDFYADVQRGWAAYSERFASDLKEMNVLATSHGLSPVVCMVVSQSPASEGRAWDIAMNIEAVAAGAGMQVVSCTNYFREYNGQVMKVSPWEGHPDEQAHRIFAEQLKPVLMADLAPMLGK